VRYRTDSVEQRGVADDDVFVRNLVTILLQGKGYLVLSASDGQEALNLSRKYPGRARI
jgi:CheY-like chemotaxis protein